MPQNTRRYFEELGEAGDYPQRRSLSPSDPEFAALIRSKIGAEYQHLANPEALGLAGVIGNPEKLYDLRAIYLGPEASLPDRMTERNLIQEQLGNDPGTPGFIETITNTPNKRMLALGRGANAKVWAHEYRHQEVNDEVDNRIQDLINATSYPDYKHSITSLYNYTSGNVKNTDKVPFAEKEAFVLSHHKVNYELIRRIQKRQGKNANWEDADNFIKNNINMNRSGAKGAHDAAGKKLDDFTIKTRADIPLLNFIGMGKTSELTPVKKAAGGAIENTTHYRKIL